VSCVVRIAALEAFAALIELAIPELAGHVCAGTAPSGELEELPNLSIMPQRWKYIPEQASEVATLPGNRVVYDVGDHDAACVVSIMATSPTQRARLEAKVLDLFLRTKHPLTDMHMPGVVVLLVSACPDLSAWSCAFDLESDEWIDTLALDRRYESRIMITASIPALTVDAPVYSIDQLILGVTHDLTSTFTPATAIPPAVELVTINADGTISPFTP